MTLKQKGEAFGFPHPLEDRIMLPKTGFIVATSMLLAAGLMAQEKPKNNWQRMKECAAQAEKYAGSNLTRSHYSPKYERCFALVQYIGKGYRDWELIDAFEGTSLAFINTNSANDEEACAIDDAIFGEHDHTPCTVVRKYIDEHLKN